MKAFFDTNIYIDVLKGSLPLAFYECYLEKYIIRLSPVVYQELIRCVTSAAFKKKVEKITHRIIFFPPPTTKMWIMAGNLSGKIMGSSDELTLEKIQNDILIALTARENGALLITQDKHFHIIQKHIPFSLILHSNEEKSAS